MASVSKGRHAPRRRARGAANKGRGHAPDRSRLSPYLEPVCHTRYEIRVEGRLDVRWATWFGNVQVTTLNGKTTITGVFDQPKLRGILNKIWDLNLTLMSVNRIEMGGK